MLSFQCPYCEGEINVPDEMSGQRGNCGHCDRSIVAPFPPPTPPTLTLTTDRPPRLRVRSQDPPPTSAKPRSELSRAVTWGFGVGCGLLLLLLLVFVGIPVAIISIAPPNPVAEVSAGAYTPEPEKAVSRDRSADIQVADIRVEDGRRGYVVSGAIRNAGAATLGYIEITVYFLDAAATPISEAKYCIFNTVQLFDPDSPLRPGYVKEFGVPVQDDAPPGWSGYVRVAVTRADVEARR
jgi:hypothetical protein